MIESLPADTANIDLSFVIEKASAVVLRSPVETPVQTSFGTMYDRPALYIQLQDSNGHSGTGEVWCNFPSCGAEHRQRLLETALFPALAGREFTNPVECFDQLHSGFRRLALQAGEPGPVAQCIAGIDIGLWDLVSKRAGQPLHRVLGSEQTGPTQTSIGVYSSGINPHGAYDTFLRCRDAGYTAFKLKIGFADEIDFANIERICSQLHPNEQLMVDANQAWSLDEAKQQVKKLSAYPLAWLEEPLLADSPVDHWNTLAAASGIPLAAGENIADRNTFAEANQSDWLTVMQPDVCKWGGVSGVLPVAKEAIACGKRYCPHFLGGGVGLLASAHLLAAAAGSGMLEIDANPNPLREKLYSPDVSNGQVVISNDPGLGIDPDQLATLQNDPNILSQ